MAAWIAGTFALCILPWFPAAAAGEYPDKPVRFIVPFPPGGSTDTLARAVSPRMKLGQQVVVDNRPGAGGVIGMEIVKNAAPDGYTVVQVYTGSVAILPQIKTVPYDPVRDFAAITQFASSPLVIVAHPSLPVHDLKELVTLAKAKPRQINFASTGVAGLGHLAGVMLSHRVGIEMTFVPYKGNGQAVVDLVGGQVQLMFSGFSAPMPYIKSGRLRALAVTSVKRSPALPDVPTTGESGLDGFHPMAWYGVVAPAGTPEPVIARLYGGFSDALKQPDVREQLSNLGFEIAGSSPRQFSDYVKSEIRQWGNAIRASGVRLE